MRTNPPPVHQLLTKFRVYPAGKGLYFHCFVWDTKDQMQRFVRAQNPGSKARRANFLAIVCGFSITHYSKNRPARMLPILGEIHFFRGSLRMGIITHESGHAAMQWCRRMKIDPTQATMDNAESEGEERFCWALGNIGREIVLRTLHLADS